MPPSVWDQERLALAAIYDPEHVYHDSSHFILSNIPAGQSTFTIQIWRASDYPDSPCHVEVLASWLPEEYLDLLGERAAEETFQPGVEILLDIIQWVTENIPPDTVERSPVKRSPDRISEGVDPEDIHSDRHEAPPTVGGDGDGRRDGGDVHIREDSTTVTPTRKIEVYHGKYVIDRKSVFQGHVAHVNCLEDVQEVLATLLSHNKIAKAAHNMYTYRFEDRSELVHKDHDSDGETGAGSNMQWLVDTLGVKNVLVVVTRWWGGIKLGADRFRHINSVTRSVIEARFEIPSKSQTSKRKKKAK